MSALGWKRRGGTGKMPGAEARNDMPDKLPPPSAAGRSEAGETEKRAAVLGLSLSNKLLVLTLLFVMVAEVLIYIPSIANYRNVWLKEKLDTSELVAMAVSAAPEGGISANLEEEMLRSINVDQIALRSAGQRWLISVDDMPRDIAAHHDLRWLKPLELDPRRLRDSVLDRRPLHHGERSAAGRQRPLRDRRA